MTTIIFTDGASRGNPGKGGFGAIINDGKKVLEIGGREEMTTNNRMEMKACIEALKKVSDDEVIIYSDSSYLINGITKWVFGWQKNNWQTKEKEDVLNKDLWQELLEFSQNKKIKWQKIDGHSGVEANERCDEIATSFADQKDIKLFSGDLKDYKISFDVSFDAEKKKNKSGSKEKAYSYVSKISGKIFIDSNWEDCKKRVNGVKGVKYKKSISKVDEENIVKEFNNFKK